MDEWAGHSHSLMNCLGGKKLICEESVESKQSVLNRCRIDAITGFLLECSTLLIVCPAINSELCGGVQNVLFRFLGVAIKYYYRASVYAF